MDLQHYLISGYYMGENFDESNYVKNFASSFNNIVLGGKILSKSKTHIIFQVEQIESFECDVIIKTGDKIKIDIDSNKEPDNYIYYRANVNQFPTDLSVLCEKKLYQEILSEKKFEDLIDVLDNIDYSNDYEKKYLISKLDNYIQKIKNG